MNNHKNLTRVLTLYGGIIIIEIRLIVGWRGFYVSRGRPLFRIGAGAAAFLRICGSMAGGVAFGGATVSVPGLS